MQELMERYIIDAQDDGSYAVKVPHTETPKTTHREIRRMLKEGLTIDGEPIARGRLTIHYSKGKYPAMVILKPIHDLQTTKLDMYDYTLDHIREDFYCIRIKVSSTIDSTIADIASEITATDGHIYVETKYFSLNSMETIRSDEDYTTTLLIYATEERP